jgi:hypothetical protein
VAVPPGTFLTSEQIDRLQQPPPALLADAPPGSTVLNDTPERDAGPVIEARDEEDDAA